VLSVCHDCLVIWVRLILSRACSQSRSCVGHCNVSDQGSVRDGAIGGESGSKKLSLFLFRSSYSRASRSHHRLRESSFRQHSVSRPRLGSMCPAPQLPSIPDRLQTQLLALPFLHLLRFVWSFPNCIPAKSVPCRAMLPLGFLT